MYFTSSIPLLTPIQSILQAAYPCLPPTKVFYKQHTLAYPHPMYLTGSIPLLTHDRCFGTCGGPKAFTSTTIFREYCPHLLLLVLTFWYFILMTGFQSNQKFLPKCAEMLDMCGDDGSSSACQQTFIPRQKLLVVFVGDQKVGSSIIITIIFINIIIISSIIIINIITMLLLLSTSLHQRAASRVQHPKSCGSQQSLPPGGKERLHFVGIRPEVQARKGGW